MASSGKAPASAEMAAAYFATHRVCSTNLCASQRKKQYAGIHDLLYVGVLPDNLDIAAAATIPKSQRKHDAPADRHGVWRKIYW